MRKFIRQVEVECFDCGSDQGLKEVSYEEEGKHCQDYFCSACAWQIYLDSCDD